MRKTTASLFCLSLMIAAVGVNDAQAVTFTGNVDVDFAGITTEIIDSTLGDPVLPPGVGMPYLCGWDIDRVVINLDEGADVLQVGIKFKGIAGDADGDGDASNTDPWMIGIGGIDVPDLGDTESICVVLDLNNDGLWEMVAGVPVGGDISDFNVAAFLGANFPPIPSNPGYDFGPVIGTGTVFYSPSPMTPDFELSIDNGSLWLNGSNCFRATAYAGSQQDGPGEDVAFDLNLCFPDIAEASSAPESMDLISSYPNPFNPVTNLSVNLAETGVSSLTIYNLSGQEVVSLHNGMLEAGSHTFVFDASQLNSGIYFANLQTVNSSTTSRLLLIK